MRFRILEVYSNSHCTRNCLCYKTGMTLRKVLLANIHLQMARRSIASMTELAKLSKVPQSTLSKFETGVHDSIKLEHIAKIARSLHLDPAQLFLDTSSTSIPPMEAQSFLGVMEKLDPSDRGVLMATGYALVESRKKA